MRLYNTLTRRVEEFVPRDPGRVGMYVCGPTVYDVPHFGHARAEIVPDVLRRYLEWTGYEVFHVRNITDIEDKILRKADAEGRPSAEISERYARIYEQQVARLNVLPPHVVPRATGHIIEMIELIRLLIEAGAAYEAGGDVLFSVRKFPRYGRLSGRDVDELRAGARVEPGEEKRDPLDFVLWKAAKPGEPSWASPWGPGRPGWHIECSAMSTKYLGAGFDIHAGGLDLQFPHHENEIAQFEAATDQGFARWWVHNGMLTIDAVKMSKSLGNFITLTEALDRYGPEALRQFYLSAHYRSPIDFNQARLAEARAGFERLRAFVRAAADLPDAEPTAELAHARDQFRTAMDDDLGTPQAQAVLFDLVTAGHAQLAAGHKDEAAATRDLLVELAGVLGYDLAVASTSSTSVAPLVSELLALREEARARRDFTTADRIRDRVTEAGIVIEDTPDGPRWHALS
ncbi:MAG: cysteine--tRNA ligase [Egibacteraceae bacterium]